MNWPHLLQRLDFNKQRIVQEEIVPKRIFMFFIINFDMNRLLTFHFYAKLNHSISQHTFVDRFD